MDSQPSILAYEQLCEVPGRVQAGRLTRSDKLGSRLVQEGGPVGGYMAISWCPRCVGEKDPSLTQSRLGDSLLSLSYLTGGFQASSWLLLERGFISRC